MAYKDLNKRRAKGKIQSARYRKNSPENVRSMEQRRHERRKHNPAYKAYMKAYHQMRWARDWDNRFGWEAGTCRRKLDEALVCESCGKPFYSGKTGQKVIDHDHDTMTFRGIIHGGCNLGIGNLQHDPEKCLMAAEYLKRWLKGGPRL